LLASGATGRTQGEKEAKVAPGVLVLRFAVGRTRRNFGHL
jgi:hypothetical protein